MLAQHRKPVNIPALLCSIRRFIEELEVRNDPIEIADWECQMWDLTSCHDLRRSRIAPARLPMVTKWRDLQ